MARVKFDAKELAKSAQEDPAIKQETSALKRATVRFRPAASEKSQGRPSQQKAIQLGYCDQEVADLIDAKVRETGLTKRAFFFKAIANYWNIDIPEDYMIGDRRSMR
ncbi:hypothetical protein ACTU44_21775 (plasmid) [Thalassospira sp. SM2505]